MESEIKLAWKMGFVEALIQYSITDVSRDKMDQLAEKAWKRQQAKVKVPVQEELPLLTDK